MMNWLAKFWNQPNRHYRNFQIVYAALTLNFFIPCFSYAFDWQGAMEGFRTLGALTGAAPYTVSEQSYVWRFLAVSNVMTLAFTCFLLQIDLRRFFVVVIPLVFLKGMSSLGALAIFLFANHFPGFLAVFFWDGLAVALMIYFAVTAHRSIASEDAFFAAVPVPGALFRYRPGVLDCERRWFGELADAIIPVEPGMAMPWRATQKGALGEYDTWVSQAPFLAAVGVRLVTAAVYWSPPLVIGRLSAFGGLAQEDQEVVLNRIGDSPVYVIRQMTLLLKTVACNAYFGDPEVRGTMGIGPDYGGTAPQEGPSRIVGIGHAAPVSPP